MYLSILYKKNLWKCTCYILQRYFDKNVDRCIQSEWNIFIGILQDSLCSAVIGIFMRNKRTTIRSYERRIVIITDLTPKM